MRLCSRARLGEIADSSPMARALWTGASAALADWGTINRRQSFLAIQFLTARTDRALLAFYPVPRSAWVVHGSHRAKAKCRQRRGSGSHQSETALSTPEGLEAARMPGRLLNTATVKPWSRRPQRAISAAPVGGRPTPASSYARGAPTSRASCTDRIRKRLIRFTPEEHRRQRNTYAVGRTLLALPLPRTGSPSHLSNIANQFQ